MFWFLLSFSVPHSLFLLSRIDTPWIIFRIVFFLFIIPVKDLYTSNMNFSLFFFLSFVFLFVRSLFLSFVYIFQDIELDPQSTQHEWSECHSKFIYLLLLFSKSINQNKLMSRTRWMSLFFLIHSNCIFLFFLFLCHHSRYSKFLSQKKIV